MNTFLIISIALVIITIFWFREFIIDSQRDISKVALQQQTNVAIVRKEHETAHYRNFMIPLQFPLNTGLSLSLGYKIRNGNIGDLWNAILELNKSNEGKAFISFNGKRYTLGEINGMIQKCIIFLDEQVSEKEDPTIVGIAVPILSLPGFIISMACMIKTIKCGKDKSKVFIPQYIPIEMLNNNMRNNIDILVLDSIEDIQIKEHSYDKIIICHSPYVTSLDQGNNNDQIHWEKLIQGSPIIDEFTYNPPHDNSDDLKPLYNITTADGNFTTCFSQLNLVSSVSSFIKSFPLGHELNSNDLLTIVDDNRVNNLQFQSQIWPKIMAILLYGGSIDMKYVNLTSPSILHKNTTLLFARSVTLKTIYQRDYSSSHLNLFQKMKFKLGQCLLSSGILPENLFNSPVGNIRCIFLHHNLNKINEILQFNSKKLPSKYKKGQFKEPLTNKNIDNIRIIWGTRIIVELYSDNLNLGPISSTNFFDYRPLPKSTSSQVTCFGSISMSLESKLIETKNNPQLDIKKRQGMLCIRGFTIGRPLEIERIQSATELSETMAHGEGWVPLVGVYGLWGYDGCLYLFK